MRISQSLGRDSRPGPSQAVSQGIGAVDGASPSWRSGMQGLRQG